MVAHGKKLAIGLGLVAAGNSMPTFGEIGKMLHGGANHFSEAIASKLNLHGKGDGGSECTAACKDGHGIVDGGSNLEFTGAGGGHFGLKGGGGGGIEINKEGHGDFDSTHGGSVDFRGGGGGNIGVHGHGGVNLATDVVQGILGKLNNCAATFRGPYCQLTDYPPEARDTSFRPKCEASWDDKTSSFNKKFEWVPCGPENHLFTQTIFQSINFEGILKGGSCNGGRCNVQIDSGGGRVRHFDCHDGKATEVHTTTETNGGGGESTTVFDGSDNGIHLDGGLNTSDDNYNNINNNHNNQNNNEGYKCDVIKCASGLGSCGLPQPCQGDECNFNQVLTYEKKDNTTQWTGSEFKPCQDQCQRAEACTGEGGNQCTVRNPVVSVIINAAVGHDWASNPPVEQFTEHFQGETSSTAGSDSTGSSETGDSSIWGSGEPSPSNSVGSEDWDESEGSSTSGLGDSGTWGGGEPSTTGYVASSTSMAAVPTSTSSFGTGSTYGTSGASNGSLPDSITTVGASRPAGAVAAGLVSVVAPCRHWGDGNGVGCEMRRLGPWLASFRGQAKTGGGRTHHPRGFEIGRHGVQGAGSQAPGPEPRTRLGADRAMEARFALVRAVHGLLETVPRRPPPRFPRPVLPIPPTTPCMSAHDAGIARQLPPAAPPLSPLPPCSAQEPVAVASAVGARRRRRLARGPAPPPRAAPDAGRQVRGRGGAPERRVAEQVVHALERPALGLGVQGPDDLPRPSAGARARGGGGPAAGAYRRAGQVDGREDEVDAAPEVGHADGPDLGHDDASDGAARRGQVEAAGPHRRGEDLSPRLEPADAPSPRSCTPRRPGPGPGCTPWRRRRLRRCRRRRPPCWRCPGRPAGGRR